MTGRAIRALALTILCAACAGRSPSDIPEPARPLGRLDVPALVFPTIDSATLASLSAQLERLAQDTLLLSSVSPSDPRFYALFRELEAAHETFEAALRTPDATGQTLYDRFAAMSASVDSVFRAIEGRKRQVPRP
jgi:hypothetical protein